MRMGSNRRLANVKTRRETGLDYIMQSIDLHFAHMVGLAYILNFYECHTTHPMTCLFYVLYHMVYLMSKHFIKLCR